MSAPPAGIGPARAARGTERLLVVATAMLVGFYYLMRVDAIGVSSPARGWAVLTGRPLPPVLHFALSALVLGVVPVLVARRWTGCSLADLGLGLGRWRRGLAWLALGVPLAVLAGKLGSASPLLRAVYPLDPSVRPTAASFLPYAAMQFLYFGSWEVLFRGVLLFGLRDRLGASPANGLQTAVSVTAHFGRALPETAAALPAGLVFGRVALDAGSIWCVAVIHWIVGVSQDWFILARGCSG